MKIIKIDQGTPEWHQWRIGAELLEGYAISATAATAIAGTSEFMSKYRLWQEMSGRKQPQTENRFMAAGKRNEPRARELYETYVKERFGPECIQSEKNPWVRASLDGLAMFQDKNAEIKCLVERNHEEVIAGVIKPGYYDQMQWQMLATDGAVTECDYVSYFKYSPTTEYPNGREDLRIINVKADEKRQNELLEMAIEFRKSLIDDIPPSGAEFEQAAHVWLLLDAQIKALQEKADAAKEILVSLLPKEGNGQCPGVTVYSSGRKGSTKWQEVAKALIALPEVAGLVGAEKFDELILKNTGESSSTVTVKASNDAAVVIAGILERSKLDSTESSTAAILVITENTSNEFSMNW